MESSVKNRRLSTILLWLSLFLLAPTAHATGLTFNGLVQVLNLFGSTSVNAPSGIAPDLAGDVFISDTGNNRIIELYEPNNQITVAVINITGLSPALNAPQGILVDPANNLYIADTGNNRIVKVTPAGGAP